MKKDILYYILIVLILGCDSSSDEWTSRGNSESNPEKQIEYYSKAIELDPLNKVAYNNRGVVYYDNEEFSKALADFFIAIELDLNYTDAYAGRAAVYVKEKKYQKAIIDFNKALRLDPSFLPMYYSIGSTYALMDSVGKALDYLDKFIVLGPKYKDKEDFYRWIAGFIQNDTSWDKIRYTREFKRIMKQIKKK